MAQHQVLQYAGTNLISDANNTAGAIVERDASGNTFQNQANVTNLNATGAPFFAVQNFATTATLDKTCAYAHCDATAAAFTVTLPPVATVNGMRVVIRKTDSGGNLVTVKGAGTELINGANTYIGLAAQFNVVVLYSDGTRWWIDSSR